ncbi:hypothetical protein PsYK624_054200 [Phanerochaete sordida]|uniref:Uncharacterized protein n=1 Tax=Phanerochaete sordida TaxID=48140 RepID=A0A9P3LBB8_9APHY|nr:hypothetical protein PsYK624_054200 [Phanerochaete sordida]
MTALQIYGDEPQEGIGMTLEWSGSKRHFQMCRGDFKGSLEQHRGIFVCGIGDARLVKPEIGLAATCTHLSKIVGCHGSWVMIHRDCGMPLWLAGKMISRWIQRARYEPERLRYTYHTLRSLSSISSFVALRSGLCLSTFPYYCRPNYIK